MASQNVSHSPSTERLTTGVYKEFRRSDRTSNRQPSTECRSRCFPKRQRALAATLAPHADTRRLGRDFVDPQARQFGDSKTSAHRKMQHGSISNPLPRRRIRGVKQGLHFILDEIRYQAAVGFLKGNRQNAANLFDCGWLTVLQKAEE